MTHVKKIIEAGLPLHQTKKALILLHGRGGSAEDILTLRDHLPLHDFYIVAPQATNNSWYPFSFLAPIQQNEPWFYSALAYIKSIVDDILAAGIQADQIYIGGFSQGACLTLEFTTRNAQRWGGVFALTGGLIGDKIYPEHYQGDFAGTQVFIANSQNDPHVPLTRSEDSKRVMEKMGAKVNVKVYHDRPHTILMDELQEAGKILTS
jgi:phospholipase/carboxylesterase